MACPPFRGCPQLKDSLCKPLPPLLIDPTIEQEDLMRSLFDCGRSETACALLAPLLEATENNILLWTYMSWLGCSDCLPPLGAGKIDLIRAPQTPPPPPGPGGPPPPSEGFHLTCRGFSGGTEDPCSNPIPVDCGPTSGSATSIQLTAVNGIRPYRWSFAGMAVRAPNLLFYDTVTGASCSEPASTCFGGSPDFHNAGDADFVRYAASQRDGFRKLNYFIGRALVFGDIVTDDDLPDKNEECGRSNEAVGETFDCHDCKREARINNLFTPNGFGSFEFGLSGVDEPEFDSVRTCTFGNAAFNDPFLCPLPAVCPKCVCLPGADCGTNVNQEPPTSTICSSLVADECCDDSDCTNIPCIRTDAIGALCPTTGRIDKFSQTFIDEGCDPCTDNYDGLMITCTEDDGAGGSITVSVGYECVGCECDPSPPDLCAGEPLGSFPRV